MAKTDLICRVCGKVYKGCKTPGDPGTFRWQNVTCSPECGAEYLKKIQISRGIIKETTNSVESGESQLVSLFETDDEYGFNDEPDEDYDNNFVSGE